MARRSSANSKEAMTVVRGQHKVALWGVEEVFGMGAQNGDKKAAEQKKM